MGTERDQIDALILGCLSADRWTRYAVGRGRLRWRGFDRAGSYSALCALVADGRVLARTLRGDQYGLREFSLPPVPVQETEG